MIRTKVIYEKVAVVVMTVCALLVTSCDSSEPAVLVEVSAQFSEVPAQKGSMFDNVKCAGEWTLRLEKAGAVVDWAELSKTAGSGNSSTVQLKYDENTSQQHRTLTIIATSASQWGSCTVTQLGSGSKPGTGGGQNSGGQGPGDENQDAGDGGQDDGSDGSGDGQDDGSGSQSPGVSAGVDLKKASWLELPTMDDPELGYYTHSFQMGGKTYRNYSFGWSQKDRVAIWVAYPLCPLYTNGNVGRTEAWALDPLLGEDSAAPFGGYAGDYARGHQLPSADRQCCYEANAQTFYGTNMTPQLNAHNSGIWSELENKVRVIANKSDTTYVVTGVIVSASSRKEKDSYGNSVTIPDAYFKVLLRYLRSSTLTPWSAAAFYLEHRSYSESIGKQHSMSVDELEEMTGLDFFANLPAMVGEDMAARLEAQDPVNSTVWW